MLAQFSSSPITVADAPASEQEREFLAAVTVRPAAPAHLPDPRRPSEYLVADVVAVGVVELLEVVYIEHGDGEVAAQPHQPLIQRPPAGQAGQLIPKRHAVGVLQHRR